MSVITELEQAAARVRDSAGAAVVGVGGGGRGAGSGVVVADGLVLTNAHNVRHDVTTVTTAGGRTLDGQVAGVDIDSDLAVLRVDADGLRPTQ